MLSLSISAPYEGLGFFVVILRKRRKLLSIHSYRVNTGSMILNI